MPERELRLGWRHTLPPVAEQLPECPSRVVDPLEKDPLQHQMRVPRRKDLWLRQSVDVVPETVRRALQPLLLQSVQPQPRRVRRSVVRVVDDPLKPHQWLGEELVEPQVPPPDLEPVRVTPPPRARA